MPQDFKVAAARFVDWLDRQVTKAGRGDDTNRLDVEPSTRFWLGHLAPEAEVADAQMRYGERGERLSPCAIGIRLRPDGPAPWSFDVSVACRAWKQDRDSKPLPWVRSEVFRAALRLDISDSGTASVRLDDLGVQLASWGADALSATLRVTRETRRGQTELFIHVVNTSPKRPRRSKLSHHLYEVKLTLSGLNTHPFLLEALPDSFRYNREVSAYGHNCGVELVDGVFSTMDTIVVERGRPSYDAIEHGFNLKFAELATNPLPQLRKLVDDFQQWLENTWSASSLDAVSASMGWTSEMAAAAKNEAEAAFAEADRLRQGTELLETDANLLRAFKLMNEAIAHSAELADGTAKYDGWRPFQLAFLLTVLPSLTRAEGQLDVVDTVWFATGGGKTETYLGLLVTAALYERLSGRTTGITAWSRFPLRMLSLQQTQRFANALAGAEIVRRRESIGGYNISLGFFVGGSSTPNRILPEPTDSYPFDIEDDAAPAREQVLLECPFCHYDSIEMAFNRVPWRLEHRCSRRDVGCPWPNEALPFYIVDDEIYRYLPTVVVGTLDKAALLASQASMLGFFGPPRGLCSVPSHGHVYAARSSKPSGCLVPGCRGTAESLPQPDGWYGISIRLQDELHLLRDSLGAVDSHYESIMDALQQFHTGRKPKIIASSATLTGHDRQVEVLYQRDGRVFPLQGAVATHSFWTAEPDPTIDDRGLLRRFVAVAPRGATHEYVNDRTTETLQKAILRLVRQPQAVCKEADIDVAHAEKMASYYGVSVVYGTTRRDVEAARRSMETEIDIDMDFNPITLTGETRFEDVRTILDRLESPEPEYEKRIHAIAASSMLSHGVDVARLNVMVMLGLPLTTAEFIQTTARVGRTYPGLVYVLHRVSRERDAANFRQFEAFVRQGDRFVDPIPVTRRSRRVLDLTLPGLAEARRLQVHEPASGEPLTMIKKYQEFLERQDITATSEGAVAMKALGFKPDIDTKLYGYIQQWMERWADGLKFPAPDARWPNDALPDTKRPMRSLRDVEPSAPIRD
ncbi:helicase-related protein [Amycolatopsis sp. NPDC051102]|uniref:helicase-related protein n=1 Tax=Amycolatopsis sp. NPDC051102 TaxID=3155163 RepID=UPI003449B450